MVSLILLLLHKKSKDWTMRVPMRIEDIVRRFIKEETLFDESSRLLVALSGGADSVALLRILIRLGYKCSAAHCNFHLRGSESLRDETFCRDLCEDLGIELFVKHFQTSEYATRNGISIEMAARELRYEWFKQLCLSENLDFVVVAHHRDDSVETVLLNLIRGTGIAGLTGINPKTDKVVRPLLNLSRENILLYLNELGQSYVTDSTNLEDAYVRNKIRLKILPLLQEINPSICESISSTAQHLRGVESIYDEVIRQSLKELLSDDGNSMDISQLLSCTSPESLLFEWLHPYGFTTAQIRNIVHSTENQAGRRFMGKDWCLLKDRDKLILRREVSPADEHIILEKIPTEISLSNGSRLQVRNMEYTAGYKIPRSSAVATLDASNVTLPLVIRRWKIGDKFAPFGMKGRKKLVSDFLTDLKLSLYEKDEQYVVADKDGRILWLIGRRSDDRFRVTEHTTNIIELKILN